MKKSSARSLPVVLLAIFLDLVSYSILIPILPQLLANPDSSYYLLPHSIPTSYGYILLGFLIAVFPIIQFFSTPILGELSDIHGRKKILIITLFGTCASLLVLGIGVVKGSLILLFISRVIGGIVGGNISVAQAAIADLTPPGERTKYFGFIGAAYGIGLIIGPVAGGLLSDGSLVSWFAAATPFWFAAGLSFINIILVYLFMSETKPRFEDTPEKIAWSAAIGHIMRAYGMKRVRAIFLSNFFFQAGITFLATFFSVYLIARFSFNQVAVGYYIGYMGICLVLVQALVLPFIAKRLDTVNMLRIALITGSAAIFAYYIPSTIVGLIVVGALVALTNGLSMAGLPALVSHRTPASVQGEILGINASVQALAQAVPPILAGFLAADIAPVAPVYIAGATIGLAWIVFIALVRKTDRD